MNAYTADFNQTLIASKLWQKAREVRREPSLLHEVVKQYKKELIKSILGK